MRFNGRLNEWNDERGFGFALVPGETERVFVHIKAFEGNPRRPEAGDMLTFEQSSGPKGPVARRIRHARAEDQGQAASATGRRSFAIDWTLAAFVLPLQLATLYQMPWPAWKWAVLPVAALVAFVAFNLDKGFAHRGQRRTPEATLHLLSIPGWVGALAAQQLFRHKSSKQAFYEVFRAIGLIQAGVLGWLLWKGF